MVVAGSKLLGTSTKHPAESSTDGLNLCEGPKSCREAVRGLGKIPVVHNIMGITTTLLSRNFFAGVHSPFYPRTMSSQVTACQTCVLTSVNFYLSKESLGIPTKPKI